MDVPPSRYKVVEQGRRLVVLDTWKGNAPVTRHAPRPDAPAPPATAQSARAALRPARPQRTRDPAMGVPDTVITTQPWFDAKGPRRVKLDGSAQGLLLVVLMVAGMAAVLLVILSGWPVLLVLGFALAQPRVRSGLRQGVTAWLDTQQPG